MDSYTQPSASSILQANLVSIAELGETTATERKWVLDGLIPEGKPILLGGPPGAGKSLLAQQICMAASLGINLFGHETNGRPTLYLTCEDDKAELQRRSTDIAKALGYPLSAFTDCYTVSLEGFPQTSLCTQQREFTEFYDELECAMAYFQFGLIVLDVVSDFWDGNEIIRQEVNHFVKGVIGLLAFRYETAIMLLHHPSVAGRTSGGGQSGSTAWEGSVRSRLYLREADKNGVRELSLKKSNYSKPKSMNLMWNEGALDLTSEIFINPALKDGGTQQLGKHASNVLGMLKDEFGEADYSRISKRFGSKEANDAVKALTKRGLVRREKGLVILNDLLHRKSETPYIVSDDSDDS